MSGLWLEREPLILASKSAIRAMILEDAGVPAEIRPAAIDERAVEARLASSSPADVAAGLARSKALDISAPGRLVLGCDQTLSLGQVRFTKPRSREDGRAQLARLSGKTHVLSSGAALARDGTIVWSAAAEARLTMRELSEPFVDAYLDAAGEAVLTSVGGYQFEGVGAQLFAEVEGDFFTILGLPLLPLLETLRDLGALAR
ncbi:Maf family protein [Chelatococcus sambhunathii]|uniref:Nucleoside triphosphate pyrophosphatase n=1 Tax=Chelatococcus sambhunathii TaxID=363953 RepID=A0ABU1DL54_9HYPH|nr:Maf family protein [Chelatococcus sambhunathii]MDR4308838.1 Maf family protein [Chelatococcus sambhunathii]